MAARLVEFPLPTCRLPEERTLETGLVRGLHRRTLGTNLWFVSLRGLPWSKQMRSVGLWKFGPGVQWFTHCDCTNLQFRAAPDPVKRWA
jgi:hypothetical protein